MGSLHGRDTQTHLPCGPWLGLEASEVAAAVAAPGPQNQREPSDRGPERDGPSRLHRQASAAMRWLAAVQPRPGVRRGSSDLLMSVIPAVLPLSVVALPLSVVARAWQGTQAGQVCWGVFPSPPVSEKPSGTRTVLSRGIKHEGDSLDKISVSSSKKSVALLLAKTAYPGKVRVARMCVE